MPQEIRVDEKLGIIVITPSDPISKEDVLEALSLFSSIFKEKGINKILADVTNLHIVPPMIDIFEIFSVFPHGFKHALLIGEAQSVEDIFRFGETVSVNRGMPTKVFTNRDDAIAWLNSP